MKSKLLIVTEALEMNGVLRSLLDFMEALDKERYEISLFCFDAFKPEFVTLPEYVKLLPEDPWCYMSRAPLSRIGTWALRRFAILPFIKRILCVVFKAGNKSKLADRASLQNEGFDIAIAYSLGMTWKYLANKIKACKKVFWVHTDYRVSEHREVWQNYLPFIGKDDRLVCVSKGICELIKAEYPSLANQTYCVHNVVNERSICDKAMGMLDRPKNDRLRLVTVGRYSSAKNQVLIPAIAKELRKQGMFDFEWIMIGSGSIQYKVEDPNLVYLDAMANPMPYIKSADIYVQPSTYEGWGLTVTEALVLQRYVVVSKIPSFEEQVEDINRGVAVALDAKEFAATIINVVREKKYDKVKTYHCPYTYELNRFEFEEVLRS